jgi:hypothetical protein
VFRSLILIAATACTSNIETIKPCAEEESPLGPQEPGTGGFSPADVLAAADGSTLHVALVETRSGRLALPYQTDWTIDVDQSGDATELTRDFPADGSNPNCATGNFVTVPVTLSLTSPDGVWEFSGDSTLSASAPTLADTTVSEADERPVMIAGPEEVVLDEQDGVASCGATAGITTVTFYDSPLSGGRLRIEIAYGDCDAEMYVGDFAGE